MSNLTLVNTNYAIWSSEILYGASRPLKRPTEDCIESVKSPALMLLDFLSDYFLHLICGNENTKFLYMPLLNSKRSATILTVFINFLTNETCATLSPISWQMVGTSTAPVKLSALLYWVYSVIRTTLYLLLRLSLDWPNMLSINSTSSTTSSRSFLDNSSRI